MRASTGSIKWMKRSITQNWNNALTFWLISIARGQKVLGLKRKKMVWERLKLVMINSLKVKCKE